MDTARIGLPTLNGRGAVARAVKLRPIARMVEAGADINALAEVQGHAHEVLLAALPPSL